MGRYDFFDRVAFEAAPDGTIWLGNNDVLGGATGGNPVVGENVTPPDAFGSMLEGVVVAVLVASQLLDGGRRAMGASPPQSVE